MSLRARLTILYSTILGGVLVLFGLAVYGLIPAVLLSQIDDILERNARDLISVARIDQEGRFVFSQRVSLDSSVLSQIWDTDGRLIGSTQSLEPDSPLRSPLDLDTLAAESPVFTSPTIGNTHFRVLTVPLYSDGEPIGTLQSGTSMTIVDAARASLVQRLLALSAVAVLLAGFLGWMSARRALSPIASVTNTALQITRADDLSRRIPMKGVQDDEVGHLVNAFNDTIARLEKLFATQRRFVADIGHELRTPLTVIRGNVDLMRRMGTEDEQSLHSIELEVQRLSRLVEDLLILAQAESGKLPMDRRRVEMDTVLLEVCNHANVLSAGRVDLEIGEIDQVLVCGDRDRLKQVALNLLANAVKYSADGGKVVVTLTKDAEQTYLRIEDDGPGIPEEDLPHIFERFYRGDKARHRHGQDGSGFGLGLSIAYWIVHNHNGQIEVQSQFGQGTTFTVRLPLADADCPDDTRELKPISAEPEHIG